MAMGKELYASEGTMLKHLLSMYEREELLDYVKELKIRRTFGIKKDKLAEKIANELLTPSVMRRRIAVLSPECRALLERAIREPFIPDVEEIEDALRLNESDYAFLNEKEQLDVPTDVKIAYENLNTPEFQEYARKMSWLSQCLNYGEVFYGVFNKDILRELFNTRSGFYISEEELEKMCNDFPRDLTDCEMEEGENAISDYLIYGSQYKELLDAQAEKDFYIPSAQEILDFSKDLHLFKDAAYQRFKEFLQYEFGVPDDVADIEILDMWDKIQSNMDSSDIVRYYTDLYADMYEDLLDDIKLEEITKLLQELNNNTRMQIHRGHTPNEMMRM